MRYLITKTVKKPLDVLLLSKQMYVNFLALLMRID